LNVLEWIVEAICEDERKFASAEGCYDGEILICGCVEDMSGYWINVDMIGILR